MKNRLLLKTFGTYLIIVLLTVGFFYLLIWQEIRKSTPDKAAAELLGYAGIIDLSSRKDIESETAKLAGISHARVTLIDEKGKVLADSESNPTAMENHFDRPEIQEARLKGKGTAIRYSRTLGIDMLYVALPIRLNHSITGYVRLARPLYEVRHETDKLYRSILIAILIMLVPALLMALMFAYRLTSPILQMEKFTDDLRQGRQPGTLILRKGSEMRQLAENLNYLVEELRNQIRSANEEKEKLTAAFSSMNEGVLVLDHEGRIESFNRIFSEMLHSRQDSIIGKTLIEAFRHVELQRALEHFKETGEVLTEEITVNEPVPRALNVSISRIHGTEGKTILVFHDVTRLKKLERMRVDFVANVTHEIKTPLTAILGFVETLQEGAIDEKETAMRFLGIIDKHARRLNRLLEDLLTISNIELGEVNLIFESVALSGIAESVLNIVSPGAEAKNLVLENAIPEGLPFIRADRDRLVQILLNILDNAVKFTPDAGKVSITAADERDGTVVVRVTDTGLGIPTDEISRLGERFYRVDRTRSRELGGTGLGLSIVKHLMAVHGGRMEIQSRLGFGTTVSLWFPVYGG